MPIVEQYWRGVLQRLQAEVEVFSSLVRHAAERGRANENALSTLLGAFVPRRFGIGTGLVIDSQDGYSRQTDIVIFEQVDEPVALAQSTHLLHPIETVLGCVEVKTTFRAEDVDDCLGKKQALLELQPMTQHADSTAHPTFIVLAYGMGISAEAIRRRFAEAEERLRPDLFCVVNYALVGGQLLVDPPPDEFPVGLALLQADGSGGELGLEEASVGPEEMFQVRGQYTYPVIDRDGKRYLGEPARALLLFSEALVRRLAEMHARPRPVISAYLTPAARSLVWVT